MVLVFYSDDPSSNPAGVVNCYESTWKARMSPGMAKFWNILHQVKITAYHCIHFMLFSSLCMAFMESIWDTWGQDQIVHICLFESISEGSIAFLQSDTPPPPLLFRYTHVHFTTTDYTTCGLYPRISLERYCGIYWAK